MTGNIIKDMIHICCSLELTLREYNYFCWTRLLFEYTQSLVTSSSVNSDLSYSMVASKVAVVLVILVLLVPNTSAPRHYQLTEDEWRKLVSAMFTGTILSDDQGRLLVHPLIMKILASCSGDRNVERNIRQDPNYIYFPSLTASYGINCVGEIVGVFFSGDGLHAEEKVLNIPLHQLHTIGISFSPCSKCVSMFGALPARLRPIIQFSWVYKHPKKSYVGRVGIGNLFRQGYNLEQWNTRFLLKYLLNQAPSDGLRRALLQTYHHTKNALFDRDMETRRLVMDEYDMYLQEEDESESDDDEDPSWTGWTNSRRRDDDDDGPDSGGAAANGGSGEGASVYSWLGSFSTNNYRKTASSYKQRSTAQHSSGWSISWIDLTATIVLVSWLILLGWSFIIKRLYRLCKVSATNNERNFALFSFIRERAFEALKQEKHGKGQENQDQKSTSKD